MARRALALVAGLILAAQSTPWANAGDDSAHALAQRFAGGGDPTRAERTSKAEDAKRRAAVKAREASRTAVEAKRRAEEARQTAIRLKADEADMLERARAEANERQAEQLRANAEIVRAERKRAEAESRAALAAAEAARNRAESRSPRTPDYASNDYAKEADERRRAQRLKAEAARSAAENARRREEERLAEAERRVKAAEERAAAAEQAAKEADERRRAEEHTAEEAVAAAARAEEDYRRHDGTPRYGGGREAGGPDRDAGVPGHAAQTHDDEFDEDEDGLSLFASKTRVTVLLVMDAGTRGIRRWGRKTADPMICVANRCFISTGSASPATELTRGRAFGPGIALGKRAGACRNSLICVFRGVDLGSETAWLQPIDLRILRHDRRQTSPISPDKTCAVQRGHLSCAETVAANGYRAWIVPEGVARRAGPEALEAALDGGLDEHGRASYLE